MLTVQLLTHNSEEHLEECLASVTQWDVAIQVGDLGSTDKTLEICRQFDVEPIKIEHEDRAAARMSLAKQGSTNHYLLLNPWEIIDNLALPSDLDSIPLSVRLFMPDSMLYVPRIWSRGHTTVKNRIAESLDCLYSKPTATSLLNRKSAVYTLEDIERWKKSEPHRPTPLYYEAMHYLSNGKYEQFVKRAEQYLFANKKEDVAATTIRFYLAVVYFHKLRVSDKATSHLIIALYNRPTMAELWCLLADMYYYGSSNYEKAKKFYNIAVTAGSCRDVTDGMFVEFRKYNEYPQTMIDSCESLLAKSKVMRVRLKHDA